MNLVITETVSNVLVNEVAKSTIVVNDFDVGLGAIPANTATTKGDILVASGAGTYTRLPADSAGKVLTANGAGAYPSYEPLTSVGVTLTNKSGGNVTAGTIVVLDRNNAEAFKTSSIVGDRRIIGVAAEAIDSNAEGVILCHQITATINTTGVVAIGDWLIQSATAGVAQTGGWKEFGNIGIALTASAGGTSTVTALILTRPLSSSGASYGYFLGGYSTASTATGDRITFSTGATAAVTTSNLSTNRNSSIGISDCNIYGYALGGITTARVATGDRITFATETTAANTASNLTAVRSFGAGISDRFVYGYSLGGSTAGGSAVVATGDRVTFSTSVTAANTASNLSQARDTVGMSDGALYGYALGGATSAAVATADRIIFSTSVTAANTASNLSQARSDAGAISDNSVYGYVLGGWTTAKVVTGDRITFSTGATAANTVSNLPAATYELRGGVSDGSVYGYIAGGNTGAVVATAYALAFSTGVPAANTTSNLSLARSGVCNISNGAV